MINIKIFGGLGNQMFEYAFAFALHMHNKDNIRFILSSKSNMKHEMFSLDKLNIDSEIVSYNSENESEKVFSIIQKIVYIIFKQIGEILLNYGGEIIRYKYEYKFQKLLNWFNIYYCSDGYVPIRFKNNMLFKNVYIFGTWQSSKYFDHIYKLIKKQYVPLEAIAEDNAKLYQLIKSKNSVCVHIRRGDYINNPIHYVCTDEYYYLAMDIIIEKVPEYQFVIFSDDIDWIKENMKFKYSVIFSENRNSSVEELRLMYSCKHFIISNSSFSWWAQYLCENEDKQVVAPAKWYKTTKPTGVYMDGWIRI